MEPTIHKYLEVRKRTEEICEPLEEADYNLQPAFFGSPAKWHLAHTTWFFEQFVLKEFLSNYKVFDKHFSFIFNSYYNNAGDRLERASRGLLSRPSVSKVYDYRKYVDVMMLEALENDAFESETIELIILGLNHEQQHQELLFTDLKFALFKNPILPVYSESTNLLIQDNRTSKWISMEEGIYSIGHSGGGFHFDNEQKLHRVFLESYAIQTKLVNNQEYLDFIEDGGYSNFNLWLDEGWSWLKENDISHPLYWSMESGEWREFSLRGQLTLDRKQALSHISYYEAAAFAEWCSKRLPTEFEWEAASNLFNWGDRWEWTNSAYLPYPGFRKAEGAIGEYNGKFMVNQMVLRGASCATSLNHSRNTYRNFFHPNLRWQYSGIRLAQ